MVISVTNTNRVFLYYEDGRLLSEGEKEAPRPPPFQFRPPKKNLRFSLETLPCVPPSSDGCCSLVEECTDSSPLWVLLQLLTPGAGVISEAEEESDRIGQTMSYMVMAVQ